MLKRKIFCSWIGLALFVVGVAFLLIPSYKEYCENHYSDKEDCAAYEMTVAIGDFLEAHNGTITAIATITIAGITWTLWQSSEKMWRVTNRSVNALTQSERAHIFIRVVDWPDISEAMRTPHGLPFSIPISIKFCFKNHGKTPAILKSISRDVAYWVAPPAWDADLSGAPRKIPSSLRCANQIQHSHA